MSCLFLSIIAFMHYEVSIIAIHLPSSHVSIFLSYSSISFMPHNFEFPTCSCHPMRTMSDTTSTISQLLTSFRHLRHLRHGHGRRRRPRGTWRGMAPRKDDVNAADDDVKAWPKDVDCAADVAQIARLPPLPVPRRWEQRSEACCGASLVSLGKEATEKPKKRKKKRNPKKDRRKKHWKLNGFRGKRRKPCCFLIKPHRIILRVVWLHFSQYHEVFHDLSTIDANTSNDDFSVEKHRSNMFNQHPCFICFTHASVCLSMPPIFQKVSQSAEIESLEVETVKTRKWTTAYLSTL